MKIMVDLSYAQVRSLQQAINLLPPPARPDANGAQIHCNHAIDSIVDGFAEAQKMSREAVCKAIVTGGVEG